MASPFHPLKPWLSRMRFARSTRWKVTLATVLATGILLTLLATGIYSFIQTVQYSSLRNEATLKMHGIRLDLERGTLPSLDQPGDHLPVEITAGNKTLYSDPLLSSLGWSNTLSQRLPAPRVNRGDQVEAGSVDRFAFMTTERLHPWASDTLDVMYTDVPTDLIPLDLGENLQSVRIALVVFDYTHESLFSFLPRALSIAVLGTTVIVAGVSFTAVTWALRPVGRIRRRLREISAKDLSQRLWVPQTGDEIQALAMEGNAALERLEIAERQQQQFIANAAHDLRSPLASLYSTLEIARLYPDMQSTEQTLHEAEEQVQRLIRLAEQLLELEQLNSSKTGVWQELEIHKIVTQTVELHSSPWPLLVDIPHQLPENLQLKTSPQHLASAVSNLLSNAQHHARSLVRVQLTYHRAGAAAQPHTASGALEIRVANDGSAIPAADQQRIFERFTRLDEARSTSHGGSGLGLSITAHIMQAAGGRVQLTRESGFTCFTLTFPALEPVNPAT